MKLYHATFKHHLESIKEHGLGGNIIKRNFDISDSRVSVYLSEDYEECEIMIEDSDPISNGEVTMEDVILFELSSEDLDSDCLIPDQNLDNPEGTTSWQYYKVIPFDKLTIFDPPM